MERAERQIRCYAHGFNTRSDESNGDLYISGYFAVFGSEYEIFPGATESVDPHAFDDALADDIRCLINHDTRLVLGRTKAGTLTLKVDSRGLWGEVRINQNDQDAMNLYERVKRRDVDQCSFGFDILEEAFEDRGDAVHWTLMRVKLYEVTVATFPAYEETGVSARERDLQDRRKRSLEATKSRIMKRLKGEH